MDLEFRCRDFNFIHGIGHGHRDASFSVCGIDGRDETHITSCKCAGEYLYKKWNKELYDHMNSGVSSIVFPSGSCYTSNWLIRGNI